MMKPALPTVVIADDHKIVTAGLVRLLADRYEIVEIVNDGRLVPDAVARLRPDVVLLDLSMPNVSGLEALRRIRARGVTSKVIMLTMHADATIAVETLKAGAAGFVLKESSGEELLAALDVVLSGGTYLAADLTKDIVNLMVGVSDPNRVELTAQQREVLRLIVRGQRAKEIANVLELSPRSVDGIKYRIMQQLDVHSTAELVRYAVENRLVAF
jgi:DNA-binding NarL/FixJ family response regulator